MSFPPKKTSRVRGVALVSALIVLALLMASVTGLMYYATNSRGRAINMTREAHRTSCAEAGLQLARAYFGRQKNFWDSYLVNPAKYNPVPSTIPGWLGTADPYTAPGRAAIMATNPELFSDIDGDGAPDVYLYIRDNEDEAPSQTNWYRNNDQQVIVGAVCISTTLTPRAVRNTAATSAIGYQNGYTAMEALLWDTRDTRGNAQSNGGDGSGNYTN